MIRRVPYSGGGEEPISEIGVPGLQKLKETYFFDRGEVLVKQLWEPLAADHYGSCSRKIRFWQGRPQTGHKTIKSN